MVDLESILLIEDNPGDTRLVREHLGDKLGIHCRFHAESTLSTGLQWLDRERPDVILLDLSLPDSDGLATYLRVHEHAARTPVVVLSGRDDDELALAAVRAGAEDYLCKQHADAVSLVRTLRHAVERRRIKEALSQSEALYRAIVETAEEGILQLDATGRIRFANARIARMLDASIESLAGRAFGDCVEPSYRGIANHMLDGGAPGQRRSAELRLPDRDGQLLWVLAAAGTIERFDGRAAETVVMLSDITGRMLAEQELVRIARDLEERVAQRTSQLQAANAQLQAFNYSVAHDLRAPLSAVQGFAALLEHDAAETMSPAQQQKLRAVRDGARDMSLLIDGLLDLARLGNAEVRREPVDLSAMAAEIVAQLRQAEPAREVDVAIEPGLQADGDAALLRSLLTNLLGNAWKYTARAPRARVHFGRVAGQRTERAYEVGDNGIGIDMASATRLFEPFVRLASARDFSGTGIGLASARSIVERHGGRLWVESQPGQGSRFRFTLDRHGRDRA